MTMGNHILEDKVGRQNIIGIFSKYKNNISQIYIFTITDKRALECKMSAWIFDDDKRERDGHEKVARCEERKS